MPTTAYNFSRLTGDVAADVNLQPGDHFCFDADGNMTPASDAANLKYGGTVASYADNTGGAAAAIQAAYLPPAENRYHTLLCSGATKAWCGVKVFWTATKNTVALAGTTTSDICAGTVVAFLDATHVIVDTADRGAVPAAA